MKGNHVGVTDPGLLKCVRGKVQAVLERTVQTMPIVSTEHFCRQELISIFRSIDDRAALSPRQRLSGSLTLSKLIPTWYAHNGQWVILIACDQ